MKNARVQSARVRRPPILPMSTAGSTATGLPRAGEGEYHFEMSAGETTLSFRSAEPDFARASLEILTEGRASAGILGGLPLFLERMRLHGIEAVSLNGRRLAIQERA